MTTNDLLNHVQHIADTLTNPSESYEDEYGDIKGDAFDYLSDALDFEWVLASDKKTLLGARILVAFGVQTSGSTPGPRLLRVIGGVSLLLYPMRTISDLKTHLRQSFIAKEIHYEQRV